MTELFEASSALVAELIRIESTQTTRCRLCFQHGYPPGGRAIEHLSTCAVGRVEAALAAQGAERPGVQAPAKPAKGRRKP